MVKKHPKADKRGPKRPHQSDKSDRTIKYTGRHYFSVNTTASSWVLDLAPTSLDARLLAISDSFENFRFTRVRIRVLSPSTPASALVAQLAYSPVTLPSLPTFGQLSLLPAYAVGSGFVGSSLPVLALDSSELYINAVKWFRRGTGQNPAYVEDQGEIFGSWAQGTSFQTSPMHMLMEYDVLLNSDMDTSFTVPMGPSKSAASSEEKDDGVIVTASDDLQRQVDELSRLLGVRRASIAPPP